MSVFIELGNTDNSNNTVHKIYTFNKVIPIHFLEDQSILNPVITVTGIFTEFNYARIQHFNRFYFIKNFEIVNNNQTRLTLKVDVLTTYENEIDEQIAIINRQEKLYNLYLADNYFKVYQNELTDQITAVNENGVPFIFDEDNFILVVAGGADNPRTHELVANDLNDLLKAYGKYTLEGFAIILKLLGDFEIKVLQYFLNGIIPEGTLSEMAVKWNKLIDKAMNLIPGMNEEKEEKEGKENGNKKN